MDKFINFNCELDISKAEENENGKWIVEGYAATTDFDMQDDIITQKAIDASANDLIQNSTVLYNHDINTPIGKVIDAKAVKGGLWIKVFISKTASTLWSQIKEGVVNKFSIKGKITDAKKQWISKIKKWVQVILKMQLVEVSMVTVPANPHAKALRWYVQKALHEYYEKGGDLDIIQGEEHMDSLNYQDEIMKADDTESVEPVDEGKEVKEEVAKADGPSLVDILEAAISMTDDIKIKEMLQIILDKMKPAPEEIDEDDIEEGQKDAGGENDVDYSELVNKTDNELIQSLIESLQSKEVVEPVAEKAGAKVSNKSKAQLNAVLGKLNDIMAVLKDFIGQAKNEKAEKLLTEFDSVKNMLGKQTEEVVTDNQNAFEKIAEIQAQLAEKIVDNETKTADAMKVISSIIKGVGAIRKEDGTLEVGDAAIKGVDHRVDDREKGITSKDFGEFKKSDEYQNADINSKRKLLSDKIGHVLQGEKK